MEISYPVAQFMKNYDRIVPGTDKKYDQV